MENNQELKEERDKIVRGLEETYKRLVESKRSRKNPIIVEKNGEIVEVDPFEAPTTTIYKRR